MAADRRALFARLDELGIASTTVEHPPVFTVEQSKALRETLPGAHTKNLFLTDRCGNALLIVAKDETVVDLKHVARRLGLGRLSFGKPELLMELLGVTPGSVTPLALINDQSGRVKVVVDAALAGAAEVNCHPLENTATTRLASVDLFRFIRACGHEPVVMTLSGADEGGAWHLPNGATAAMFLTLARIGIVAGSGISFDAEEKSMDTPILKQGEDGQDLVKNTTTKDFMRDVIEASREVPVLVDFWAPWCGPCRQLTPILEKAVRAAKGAVRLVKLNIDEHPQIPGQMGVQSIPAVFAFQDGRPVDGFMGALPESRVKAFIARLIGEVGAGAAQALEAAEAALAAGDVNSAAQAFAEVLQKDAENAQAASGLAKCYIKTGDLARAEQTLALVPPAKADSAPVASARAMLDLARKGATAGDVETLKAKLAADPNDTQSRFDLALALNAKGDRQGALEELLTIVRKDRAFNDDAARKQLLQLFDAWGPSDPATVAGRQKLSSLLFA